MIVHDEAYYESRRPIEDLGPWKNFLRFLWNSEKRAFLDRTAKDWGCLGLFYLCFFGVLFSLFALQMWIALGFVGHLDKPFMQHTSQLLARSAHERGARRFFQRPMMDFINPGLGFAPNILSPMTSPIIWVSERQEKSKPTRYVRAIENFLKAFRKNESLYDTKCSDGEFRTGFRKKPCFFSPDVLGPCAVPPYGYSKPYTPCVLLKFNRRFDWIPRYYNQTSELPEAMPYELRTLVRSSSQPRVWLSCTGASNADMEHIGEIEYYPAPGFPVEFFPFTGQRDYLAPIVAVMFKKLPVDRLVTVECTLWAQNLPQDHRYCLDFQIMIGRS